jgi:hypothetical protein
MNSNASFPFVAVPNFELTGQSVRERSSIETSSFCPIVDQSQLGAWRQFAIENQGWIEQSRLTATQLSPGGSPSSAVSSGIAISNSIFVRNAQTGEAEPATGKGPFLPWWYQTPPPEDLSIINMDIRSHATIASLFDAMQDQKHLVTSNFVNTTMFGNNAQYHMDLHRRRTAYTAEERPSVSNSSDGLDESNPRTGPFLHHDDDAAIHPHSLMLYPVFKDLVNEEMAGVLFAVMSWDAYVVNLLPQAITNIQLVVRNTCGGSVSYMLHGSNVRN